MWPSIITISDFISSDDLATIQAEIAEATFVGGEVSAGGAALAAKSNREMAPEAQYVEIVKIVERAVRQSYELNYSVFPRHITRAIISRYDVGMTYGEHIDAAVMGFMDQSRAMGPFGQNYVRSDYSMTVFLADPDSYDGGELCFDSPWGPLKYKLPAGSAVAYPTGIVHSVLPVSRGVRLAAVLWMQSMIHDHESRRLVADLNSLANRLGSMRGLDDEADVARNIAATALRIVADI
jgi:PKHD-type hydroxylase